NELNPAKQCWFAPWLCLPSYWSVLILNNSGCARVHQTQFCHSSTSIQERLGLFWVRLEHLFPAKNRQNRKFYNRLTTKDMLRVFMGSTTTSTSTIDQGCEAILWKIPGLTVRESLFGDRLSLAVPPKLVARGARQLQCPPLDWMGARVVDWARLESVCTARYRGFESLPIRHSYKCFIYSILWK